MDKLFRILLVEDDPNLGTILEEFLNLKGYEVTRRENGELGWEEFQNNTFDICLLDIMMPKMDGFTLIRNIRKIDNQIPVIFITARSYNQDKLEGFQLGADDYLTKPFSMEELQMRIKAVLRRSNQKVSHQNENKTYTIGKFVFDPKLQAILDGTKEQKLTTKESALLKVLCDHLNDVTPREYALKLIWKDDNYFTARSMDVYITKLRKYLRPDEKLEIRNIHGEGYMLLTKD